MGLVLISNPYKKVDKPGTFIERRRPLGAMPDYKRPPLKPETYELLQERKPEGVTYDHYVRQLLGVE